jgi:hypothetical protein
MADFGDFHPSWAPYKKRLTAAVALNLGYYIPGSIAIGFVLQRLTGSYVSAGVVAACWLAACALAVVRVSFFPCPRCGRPFHVGLPYGTCLRETACTVDFRNGAIPA